MRKPKKTQRREFFLLLRETLPAFLAVVILVASGVCVYTGFEWSFRGVRQSVDAELRRDAYHDVDCLRLSPFTEEEFDAVRAMDGVTAAEGYNLCFGLFTHNGVRQQAKILSLTEEIDRLYRLEGRKPTAPDEVIMGRYMAEQMGVHIGDRLSLEGTAALFLTETELTVVGLADSPAYLSDETATYGVSYLTETPLSCLLFVSREIFHPGLFPGFVGMLVRGDNLQKDSVYSQEYQKSTDALRARLQVLFGEGAELTTGAENAAITVADNAIIVFHQLKLTLGLIIVIISQMVCGITLVKLVHDRAVLIGARKILGFSPGEIILPYAAYAALASFLGAVLGLFFGSTVVAPAFSGIAKDSIFFENAVPYVSVGEGIVTLLLCVGLSVSVAVLACHKTVRRPPLDLLNREEEVSRGLGLRAGKGSRHLSLLTRTALSDLFGSRLRIIAGILSIAGCATLCVSSVYVREKVTKSMDFHYETVQSYDTTVWFLPGDDAAAAGIEAALGSSGFACSRVYSAVGQLETPEGTALAAYLAVPVDGDFDRMLRLRRPDGRPGSADEGVWINSAYADYYGIKEGDTVRFRAAGEEKKDLTVNGIDEFYLQIPLLVMSPAAYESYYGEVPAANCFFADTGRTAARAAEPLLREIDGYLLCEDSFAKNKVYFTAMDRICTVFVVIFLILSAGMAFFVILNLFVSLVERKKNELITLRINGYGKADVKRYILAELLTLALGGLLLGNVCGQFIGHLVVLCLSGNTDRFLSGFSLPACLWGSLSCTAFLAVVGAIALKKTEKFKLTEGNPLG